MKKKQKTYNLEDVCDVHNNKRNPVKKELRMHGNIPYYGANNIQDMVNGFTHNGEYVLIAEDGSASLKDYSVQYVNGKFWANNHVHVVAGKKGLNTKFLFYYLKTIDFIPYIHGGTRAKLNKTNLLKIQIAVPSLKEQKEIVEILDAFEKKIDSLESQVKNYEIYKKELVNKLIQNKRGG